MTAMVSPALPVERAPTVVQSREVPANTDLAEDAAMADASSHFYGSVGGQLLSSKLQSDGTLYDSRLNLESVTFRAGWRATPFFGLEVEADFGVAGKSFAPVGRVDFQNRYQLDIVSFLPITQNFDVLLRAGYGHLTLKSTDYFYQYGGYPNLNQTVRTSNSYTVSSYTYNYGVGLQYFLTRHDGLRLDYTGEKADKAGATEISNYSLSYVRKF
jgi:Outer membrane protein beta-barrel domain